MLVHFLRHGQSISNAAPGGMALPGAEGDHLTERGREQARAAAEELTGVGAKRILCSPLQRARETAEVLQERLELPIEEMEEIGELRESDRYGELSLEHQRHRRWSVWMAEHGDDPDYSYRGGESFNQISRRVQRAQERLLGLGEESVLAVSHGIFLRFFLMRVLFGDDFRAGKVQRLWQLGSLNCGLSVFEHRRREVEANYEIDPWTCLSWMERPWLSRRA